MSAISINLIRLKFQPQQCRKENGGKFDKSKVCQVFISNFHHFPSLAQRQRFEKTLCFDFCPFVNCCAQSVTFFISFINSKVKVE